MKKILPYILILVIVVQLFAPFTVGMGVKNKIEIQTKTVEAADNFYFWIYVKNLEPTRQFYDDIETCNQKRMAFLNSPAYKENPGGMYVSAPSECIPVVEEQISVDVWIFEVKNKDNLIIFSSDNFEDDNNSQGKDKCNVARDAKINELGSNPDGLTVEDCTKISVQQTQSDVIEKVKKGNFDLPACGINGLSFSGGTISGCFAQLLYYVLFVPTSYIFALAGTFFDFTFHYSIQDTSYRSPFVVEGWGIVRDFCNMFFIFILLYIAIGTILNLHSVKTKEMIINVVIIGLLINFSLFATHVIIDASNILARVFYTSDTIKITQGDDAKNGVANATPGLKEGPNGEIPLSAAIVNKVNPQNLIINGTKTVTITDPVTGKGAAAEEDSPLGTGAFILITLLATAVNVVGIIVFLSVGLIFVARVIGLWIAMILSPFVFFSYTVPALQDMEMVGWKKWWPETLKLAFLAPVFIFFMYIIIAFLETGLSLVKSNEGTTGLTFVISVIVPFIFIMILMMKAKDIAKKMSGTMGQQITNGIAAVGGIALGAATGGAALLGRASVGRIANKMGNSGWLNDAASGKNGKMAQFFGKGLKNATNYTSKSSFDFRQTKAGNAFTKETGMNLNTGTNFVGLDTKKGLGGYAGAQQRKIEKENKFAETLGYDHDKYHKNEDSIESRKKQIQDTENEKDLLNADIQKIEGQFGKDSDYLKKPKEDLARVMKNLVVLKSTGGKIVNTYGDEENIDSGLSTMEKDLERIKTGRTKEYALTRKRKSGRIYNHVERDSNDNIKKFGHAEKDGAQAAKQFIKEFAKGFAQGAVTGGIAGSIIPVVGTGVGIVGGGLVGAVRSSVINYSGTTNRKVGDASHGDKHEPKDNYNPVSSHSTPPASSHTSTPSPSGGGHGH